MRIHPETVALMVTPSENASQNRKNVLAAVEAAKMIGEELGRLEIESDPRVQGTVDEGARLRETLDMYRRTAEGLRGELQAANERIAELKRDLEAATAPPKARTR